ncbi:MAG: hypothetical protein HQL28_05550 [Candidatus Omnitrophica bacterium]|nr:hypothetical protein [Candidatus Omnitrophota bacterium]
MFRLQNILDNIAYTRELVKTSSNVKIVTLVSGSDTHASYWQNRINNTSRYIFNADGKTRILSLSERLGNKERMGNFLGTLFAYSKLKEYAAKTGVDYRSSVILEGMLFGRGERVSPFSQIEGGCKPAIASMAANYDLNGEKHALSQIEEALMFFAPIAKRLESGGFRGILNKWGDETEIASVALKTGMSERCLDEFDMIKFTSVQEVTDNTASSKDWVISDKDNNFVTQIPRVSRAELLNKMKSHGVKFIGEDNVRANISVGPIAISYDLLDIMWTVFADDIAKDGVSLDFDPYLLLAFSHENPDKWNEEVRRDRKLAALAGAEGTMPDLFRKVIRVRELFKSKFTRPMNFKVMSLGDDIFWNDIGQHDGLRAKHLKLAESSESGQVARSIENITEKLAPNGNIIVNSEISGPAEIKNSVIINSRISGASKITGSVIKDCVLKDISADRAFCVLSRRTGKTVLKKHSGLYKSAGSVIDPLVLEEKMRHGTLLTGEGAVDMFVSEDTDLRDKGNNYDRPILGNKISFAEAYTMMHGLDPESINERMKNLMRDLDKFDSIIGKFKQLSFGTSGLRDTVENMTDMECYINARGFIAFLFAAGEFKKGSTVAVAGDLRPSTARIKNAVSAAIRDMGGAVDDQGFVPSPVLAFYAMGKKIPSVMVTGSHIPADRNGIKFTKVSGEVLKSDEQAILAAVLSERKKVYAEFVGGASLFDENGKFKVQSSKFKVQSSSVSSETYIRRYTNAFTGAVTPGGKPIFLYQHSAVGRDIAKEIFESVGINVYAPDEKIDISYVDEEGITRKETVPLRSDEFVPVDTESVSNKTLAVFKSVMNREKINIGVTLDGDSDRPLLVYRVFEKEKPTEELAYVTGDILGLLTVIGLEEMGAKASFVAIPVSANDAVAKVLGEKGIEVKLTKIGSPYVIAAMNGFIVGASAKGDTLGNVFAWESNGGFLVGNDIEFKVQSSKFKAAVGNGIPFGIMKALPTRDAMLPLLTVITSAQKEKTGVQGLIDKLPKRFTHADRKKDFPNETSAKIISAISPEPAEKIVEMIFEKDTVVLDLDEGKIYKMPHDERSARYFLIKEKIERAFGRYGFGEVEVINYRDGVRITFTNGEISHLRPSGNAPEFRNYAVAATPERAREIVKLGLEKIIPSLADAGR